jgi:hypothetical protein
LAAVGVGDGAGMVGAVGVVLSEAVLGEAAEVDLAEAEEAALAEAEVGADTAVGDTAVVDTANAWSPQHPGVGPKRVLQVLHC